MYENHELETSIQKVAIEKPSRSIYRKLVQNHRAREIRKPPQAKVLEIMYTSLYSYQRAVTAMVQQAMQFIE